MTVSSYRTITITAAAIQLGDNLQFPTKSPLDTLDYGVIIEEFLNDINDIIATVTYVPFTSGLSLSVTDITFLGSVITFWLSGGDSGKLYPICLEIVTVGGRSLSVTVWLPVLTLSTTINSNLQAITVGPPGPPTTVAGLALLLAQLPTADPGNETPYWQTVAGVSFLVLPNSTPVDTANYLNLANGSRLLLGNGSYLTLG